MTQKLGVKVVRRDVTSQAEIEQVPQDTSVGSVDAINYVRSNLVAGHIELFIQQAKADRLSLMLSESSTVEQGAQASYGPDFKEIGGQAAKLVAKVLRGAKPAELAIQAPEKLLLAINLKTAKTIGLTIPSDVLERAVLPDRLTPTGRWPCR